VNVKTIIRWQNGLVMAFDAAGDQVRELQGPIGQLRERLKELPADGVEWFTGHWRKTLVDATKETVVGP